MGPFQSPGFLTTVLVLRGSGGAGLGMLVLLVCPVEPGKHQQRGEAAKMDLTLHNGERPLGSYTHAPIFLLR